MVPTPWQGRSGERGGARASCPPMGELSINLVASFLSNRPFLPFLSNRVLGKPSAMRAGVGPPEPGGPDLLDTKSLHAFGRWPST